MNSSSFSRPQVCYVPKYERLKQFIQRYPAGVLNARPLEGYVALMSAAAEFIEEGRRNWAPYELADGRAHLLALILHYEPTELAHSEPAGLMGVTKGNITGLVNSLERAGHVKRGERATDRRVTPIALTAAGRGLIEKALREHFTGVTADMKVLSGTEQKVLVRILAKLRRKIKAALLTV